jgi:4-hydroxythreonine-4-phosphate dehydrogenase
MGDPAGIGPEVVLKAVAEVGDRYACTVVGDRDLLAEAARRLDLPIPEAIHAPDAVRCGAEVLFAGVASAAGGRAAAAAVRAAADLVAAGEADALVTAPLNKQGFALAGEPHPGHTELLAAHFNAPRVRMMLQGGGLRVVLVTIHIALRAVPDALTVDGIVETCAVAGEALARLSVGGRLALAALNPHASDGGRFGDEEERILIPAVAAARARGIEVTGPHPADTLFARVARPESEVDAVVAMYHDQGLIPVKLAAFGKATNVTLGLPIVRTSPDHGTAYDIAGRGIADPGSLLEALDVAADLFSAK